MPEPTQRYENRKHYRGKHHHPKQNRQQKQKVTVPFLAIFMPRFDDYCAVPDDAVCKNKSATRLQPRDQIMKAKISSAKKAIATCSQGFQGSKSGRLRFGFAR